MLRWKMAALLSRCRAGCAAVLLMGSTATLIGPLPLQAATIRFVAPARTPGPQAGSPQQFVTGTATGINGSTGSEPIPTIASGGFVIAGSLSATPLTGSAHIRLIEQSPVLRGGGNFTTNLELVRGANSDPLQASFTIHQAITKRSSFRKTALGNDLGAVLGTSPPVDVPPVPPGSIRPVFSVPLRVNVSTPTSNVAVPGPQSDLAGPISAALRVPSVGSFPTGKPDGEPRIVLPGPGVYPVRVILRNTSATATEPNGVIDGFTTYLTVTEPAGNTNNNGTTNANTNANTGSDTNTTTSSDTKATGAESVDARLNVALLVPIHLQPSARPDGTTSDPNTAQVIALTEALVRRPIPPLTIEVTPEALKTLARQAADENPDRRSQVLDQLRSALNGREVIGGPFIDPSPELLDDPNLTAERIRQRIEGERTVRENLATPLPGLVVLENHIPAATSLNELGASSLITSAKALGLLERTNPDFSPLALDVLANNSTVTQPVTIHLSKATGTATTDDSKISAPTIDPTIKAVLLDVLLAQRSTETFGTREPKDDNTLRAQQFLAELGFIRSQIPANQRNKHGVSVAIPTATTSATLDAILEGIGADDGMFQPIPMSAMLALPVAKSLAFQRKEATLSVLGSTQNEELQTVHTKLLGYNALFAQPTTEAATAELGLRSVLAADRNPEDRTALLASLRSQANAMLGGLALVQSKSLTLTAREQTVKIGVLNDTNQPTNAILDLQSDNVEFIGAQIDPDKPRRSRLSVTVKLADRVQQIPVRVRTRGPGSFSFVAVLRTSAVEGAPEGVPMSSRRYTVRSTAVGKLGTIISVGALSFLGIWWLRSIFRRRRIQTQASRTRHPSSAGQ
jgi:hypothetical protein